MTWIDDCPSCCDRINVPSYGDQNGPFPCPNCGEWLRWTESDRWVEGRETGGLVATPHLEWLEDACLRCGTTPCNPATEHCATCEADDMASRIDATHDQNRERFP